jgi:hypothetical protein
VHDVAAHILDGDLRKLSVTRDEYLAFPDRATGGHLSDLFVAAARRLSPEVLVDLLAFTGPKVYGVLAALEPVSWFDIGYEYTERWHHQEQIRDAVGAPPLTSRDWLRPVFDIFMHTVPHRYSNVTGADGTALSIIISGKVGGTWTLLRETGAWHLFEGNSARHRSRIVISQDDALRLFTKGMHGQVAESRAIVEGDPELATAFFGTVAVMA